MLIYPILVCILYAIWFYHEYKRRKLAALLKNTFFLLTPHVIILLITITNKIRLDCGLYEFNIEGQATFKVLMGITLAIIIWTNQQLNKKVKAYIIVALTLLLSIMYFTGASGNNDVKSYPTASPF